MPWGGEVTARKGYERTVDVIFLGGSCATEEACESFFGVRGIVRYYWFDWGGCRDIEQVWDAVFASSP